jgi:hypothetical protein
VSSPLQNNIVNLQNILDSVNNLPDMVAGDMQLPTLTNAGAASDLMSGKQLIDASGNIVTGTHECETAAVAAQVATGTVTGVGGTAKSVTCKDKSGNTFKPDAVFFTGTVPYDGSKAHAGIAFTAGNVTSMQTLFGASSTSYVLSSFNVTQTSTGFTVSGKRVDTSLSQSNESNRSLNYIAIKYT